MSPVLVDPSKFSSAALVGYNAVVEALNPVGRWKLDDPSGTSAAAAHGTAGTYVGTPTLAAAGLITDGGTAVAMDGNTQEVTCPLSGLGSAGSILLTFATVETAQVVLFRDNTTTTGWFVQLGTTTTSPNVRVNNGNHTVVYNSNTLRNGARHQILLTTDGTTVSCYIDGVLIDSWVPTNALFSGITSPLHFGRNGLNTTATNFYAGTYDDLAVFATALTATDAGNIWAAS